MAPGMWHAGAFAADAAMGSRQHHQVHQVLESGRHRPPEAELQILSATKGLAKALPSNFRPENGPDFRRGFFLWALLRAVHSGATYPRAYSQTGGVWMVSGKVI